MHPAAGIVLGIVLVVVGLGLFFMPQLQPWGVQWFWVQSLVTVLTGMIPAFLILIGVFLVWLQADELKSSKELEEPAKEEETPKKPAKKKAKK